MATVIREADGMDEIRAMTGLMAEVWGEAFLDPGVCRAVQHAGGYLTGAWEGERLVGASMAFVGWLDGEVLLHSHATCTAPGLGSQGIGLALKWHQRRWGLDRGIRTRRVDLRPPRRPQRLVQPDQARRPGRRVRGRLLRPHDHRHRAGRGERPLPGPLGPR